jgi:hypothetical protein
MVKNLQALIINGGRSKEQGNFYDQSQIARLSVPLVGRPPENKQKWSITRDRIFDVIPLVLEGNKRSLVGKQTFRVFPSSASEATHPQIVRRVKR